MSAQSGLTVAVTGATGTFGSGLMPLLQRDDRVDRLIGVARRPFDPATHGWSKMTYRRADVRDQATLEQAFLGADVVVHLAFTITGTANPEATREINVTGTLNAFRAAEAAGARRFVYASSVAAYGFHPDNPVPMTEDWPVRPAGRLFYAREKSELEQLLAAEAVAHPDLALYLLRPPVVLGRHAVGAKDLLPGPLAPLGPFLTAGRRLSLPVAAPALPVQFVHESDVGQALLRCAVGAGPSGVYNITGDGVVTGVDVARELGFTPVRVPAGLVRTAARAITGLPRPPFAPPAFDWVEAATHPTIVDAGKAKRLLGWRPAYTGLQALRATVSGT